MPFNPLIAIARVKPIHIGFWRKKGTPPICPVIAIGSCTMGNTNLSCSVHERRSKMFTPSITPISANISAAHNSRGSKNGWMRCHRYGETLPW